MVVNDNNTGPHNSYQIGRVTTFRCNLDIAEIIAFDRQVSDKNADLLEWYLAEKWGLTDEFPPDHPNPSSVQINTSADRILTIGKGTDADSSFVGTIDEVRIYDQGLSSNEVSILYLGGSVKFRTSDQRQPPIVELFDAKPNSAESVTLHGEVLNIDLEQPIVTLFYGKNDGGFAFHEWDNNFTLNEGNSLPAGSFEANISGLTPGEKYYFRAYAEARMERTGRAVNQRSNKT